MASGSSCLVDELWHATSRRPTSFGRQDVRATWSKSVGGGAAGLGVDGLKPSM
jgi:hypothetical protein